MNFNFSNISKKKILINSNGDGLSTKDIFEIDLPIKKKSLIFLIAENNLSNIGLFYKLFLNKHLIHLIDKNLNFDFIVKLVRKFKPNYIVCNKIEIYKLQKTYKKIFSFGSSSIYLRSNFYDHNLNRDLGLLLSTSGSTGSSKLVMLSYKNIISNTENICKTLKIDNKDVTITTMPYNYTYGMSVINTHFYKNAKIIINNYPILSHDFWKILKKFKVTNINGVPFIYKMISKINFGNTMLNSMKFMTQAGGHLDENTKRQILKICEKKKIKFYIMYGSTEATSRMSILPYKFLKTKINSIGLPLKGCKFIIKNGKKIINKSFKTGNLHFSGPNVFQGYCRKINDLTIFKKTKRTLDTGDKAYKDDDGFFYFVSRSKKKAKFSGITYDLADIEEFFKKKNKLVRCTKENDYLLLRSKKNLNHEYIKRVLGDKFNLRNIKLKIEKFRGNFLK